MHCPLCGRDNRPDAAFCDACGTRVSELQEDIRAPVVQRALTEGGGSFPSRRWPARASSSLTESVFVGRQAELATLQAALEDALVGRGRLVMLVGQPGIGKTRTAREFVPHAQRRGALMLWGRCHESVGAPPYWPWVQIMRACIQGRDREQLRTEMGAGAADIATIVPEVREHWPDIPLPPHFEDPEQARFRLFDSVTTFLHNAARHAPLVLILDNLHWG